MRKIKNPLHTLLPGVQRNECPRSHEFCMRFCGMKKDISNALCEPFCLTGCKKPCRLFAENIPHGRKIRCDNRSHCRHVFKEFEWRSVAKKVGGLRCGRRIDENIRGEDNGG